MSGWSRSTSPSGPIAARRGGAGLLRRDAIAPVVVRYLAWIALALLLILVILPAVLSGAAGIQAVPAS